MVRLLALLAPPFAGTSVKMDFLPLGSVRTDPLLSPTCLSDHVPTHTPDQWRKAQFEGRRETLQVVKDICIAFDELRDTSKRHY